MKISPILFISLLIIQGGCKTTQNSTTSSWGFQKHQCSIAWPDSFASTLPQQLQNPEDIQHELGWDRIFMGAATTLNVYDEPEQVKEATKSLNYDRINAITENDNLAIIATKGQCTHLFFRGSYNLKNWFSNAAIRKKRVKHGKIHVGFYNILEKNNFYKKIIETLRLHNYENNYFQVSGHSLGGALAGAFSYFYAVDDYTKERKDIDLIVTLGQPLFADSNLANFLRDEYAGRFARVVYKSDIVAKVPPTFEHFGSLIWINHEDKVEYFPEKPIFSGGSGPSSIRAKIPDELTGSEADFREFRRNLRNNPKPQKPEEPEFEGSGPYKGTFDYFADHSILVYFDYMNIKQ